LRQYSPCAQKPSPQPPQAPQSASQTWQFSRVGSQLESTVQVQAVGQSMAQLWQLSPGSHSPLPQAGAQAPQSIGQSQQPSLGAQRPSPQVGQRPQSVGHVPQNSLPLQLPSAQAIVGGVHPLQSAGQASQVSPLSQSPSPQMGGQTQPAHVHASKASQTSSVVQLRQRPQSAMQLLQLSPGEQSPSPQLQEQSEGQLRQFSPGSQLASPHSQAQSVGQPRQFSSASQVPSLQRGPGQSEGQVP
jgi:hypothetical protein